MFGLGRKAPRKSDIMINSEVQTYVFDNKDVRTLTIDNEPWFVGKDVASVLGYTNPRKALRDHVDDEDSREERIVTPSGNQATKVINESGLYSLIISSKLPSAKKFKHWVTSEVLPSIRKHGVYATPVTIDSILADPDSGIRLLQELKEERRQKEQALLKASKEREGRLIAEQKVNEYEPKASYYDLILQNKSLMNITQIAKDYGMSGAEMNKKLHELGVQFKQGGNWLLYAKYQKNGWTQSTTELVNHGKKVVLHTKWTQKGRIGIYQILKESGILPLIEREN